MNSSLSYCPDLEARLERLRALYERRAGDRILAQMSVSGPVLARFAEGHEAGYSPRPDLKERVRFWDELLREKMAVQDDVVPCAYLSEMDQGLYGGLVGGQVQYMTHPENGWISSMVPPILKDWKDVCQLRVDENGEAFRYYLEELKTFVKAARGKFGISHFILIDALNFVFELVGATQAYLVVEDDPEGVRRVIDFAFRLNVMVQKTFFEHVELLAGGTCSNMVGWVPGRIVSESVDPFHMASKRYFEQWGREPVERVFAEFDGGVVHIHGNGRHLLPAVATLKGLKGVCLLNDRGYAPAVTEVRRLQAGTGDLPLIVDVVFEDFVQVYEQRQLAGGALYKVREVPDVETANRWMEKVREYRV